MFKHANPNESFDRYPYLSKSMTGSQDTKLPGLTWDRFHINGSIQSIAEVKRLIEYQAAHQVFKSAFVPPKKLTFEEWWKRNSESLQLGGPAPKSIALIIWLQAQENK